jgi:hypothetical protein
MEHLANDTWQFVCKNGDGALSLRFHSPNGIPDLRHKVEQLRCKINKPNFIHPKKIAIDKQLTSLLGIDGGSPEWRYLNKGTHEEEDRAEFDRATVETIITSLMALDTALKDG